MCDESCRHTDFRKRPDETWREAVARFSKTHDKEAKALETFDRWLGFGRTEERAAFEALYAAGLI